jgi:polysaccharide chain length determinant protein (PEP-CTERM system associated)
VAGNIFNVFFDEIQRIWRYRLVVLCVAVPLFCAAAVYVMGMPNVYDSWAQIYVNKETPVSAAAHGVSLVGDNFGSAYVVQKTLLNDEYLKQIVFTINPAARALPPDGLAKAIAALRGRIRVDPDQGDGFFQIHFQDSDPVRARDIVQMLLNQFIAANIMRARDDLGRASDFLDTQIASYAVKVRAADADMIKFSRAHPGIGRTNGTAMVGDAMSDVATAQAAYSSALGARGGDTGNGDAGQVATLRARIESLRTQYTDQYPDVVAAQRQLDALLASQKTKPVAVVQSDEPSSVREARNALSAAQGRLHSAQMGPPPSPLDAEWADLKKKSEIVRSNYEEMLSRREAARMSQAVYADKNSGKYQVTSLPTVPPVPTGPNRRLYLLLAAIVALGTGVAAAYLRGAINGIFVAPRELEEVFGLPLAGTVSLEKAWRTDGVRRIGKSASALAIAFVFAGTAGGLLAASGLFSATHAATQPSYSGNIIRIELSNSFAVALPREYVR